MRTTSLSEKKNTRPADALTVAGARYVLTLIAELQAEALAKFPDDSGAHWERTDRDRQGYVAACLAGSLQWFASDERVGHLKRARKHAQYMRSTKASQALDLVKSDGCTAEKLSSS